MNGGSEKVHPTGVCVGLASIPRPFNRELYPKLPIFSK
jgi:hypothetical protein